MPDLFHLLDKVSTVTDAIDILDKQFKTPAYAWHQLLFYTQKPGELISYYARTSNDLKFLVNFCECKGITAEEHQDLLRDSLISGTASDSIRVHLLELHNAHVSLNKYISLAMVKEI